MVEPVLSPLARKRMAEYDDWWAVAGRRQMEGWKRVSTKRLAYYINQYRSIPRGPRCGHGSDEWYKEAGGRMRCRPCRNAAQRRRYEEAQCF